MKKTNLHRLALTLLTAATLLAAPLSGPARSTQRIDDVPNAEAWIARTFAKGKTPPFSFVYDGRPSQDFIRRWKYTATKLPGDDPQIVEYRFDYLDPEGGMKAECHVRGFRDFDAVEWTLHFVNTSDANSATLEQVRAMDLSFRSRSEAPFRLHHAKGSHYQEGVQDFRPFIDPLGTDARHFTPEGGRSSDRTAFPFYNLEAPDGAGAMIAVGWTGNWYAEFSQPAADAAACSVGLEHLETFLYPGESIRLPQVCLLFWQDDDFLAGHNAFRRFMLAHHTPRIAREPATGLLSATFSAAPNAAPCALPSSCLTEAQALSFIDRYRYFNLRPDIFWLDAGWAAGTGYPSNYTEGAGTQEVDAERFPDGFRRMSEAAHRIGAKFMVWFEPERVYRGSWLERNRPEWLLRFPDNPISLLDLGNPEACEWVCRQIGDIIEQNGIDYYRQDCNIHPGAFWNAFDEPGRIGMREIRHVEGLYKFWDYLLDRFPNLLIDNCAGGGRRLDLETMSRSIPLWRTDYEGNAVGSQCHTYGLNLYLPIHGIGLNTTDDYSLHSFMSGAMVLNWNVFDPKILIADMQARMEKYRELSPYFREDYYPLTGFGDLTGDDVWLAYQLHRPSDDTGLVVAFRRKDSPEETIRVRLRGLDPARRYELLDEGTGTLVTLRGNALASGLTLKIGQKPGSQLLRYRPAAE